MTTPHKEMFIAPKTNDVEKNERKNMNCEKENNFLLGKKCDVWGKQFYSSIRQNKNNKK